MHTDENVIFAALSTLGKYKNTQPDIHVLSNVISTLRWNVLTGLRIARGITKLSKKEYNLI